MPVEKNKKMSILYSAFKEKNYDHFDSICSIFEAQDFLDYLSHKEQEDIIHIHTGNVVGQRYKEVIYELAKEPCFLSIFLNHAQDKGVLRDVLIAEELNRKVLFSLGSSNAKSRKVIRGLFNNEDYIALLKHRLSNNCSLFRQASVKYSSSDLAPADEDIVKGILSSLKDDSDRVKAVPNDMVRTLKNIKIIQNNLGDETKILFVFAKLRLSNYFVNAYNVEDLLEELLPRIKNGAIISRCAPWKAEGRGA